MILFSYILSLSGMFIGCVFSLAWIFGVVWGAGLTGHSYISKNLSIISTLGISIGGIIGVLLGYSYFSEHLVVLITLGMTIGCISFALVYCILEFFH